MHGLTTVQGLQMMPSVSDDHLDTDIRICIGSGSFWLPAGCEWSAALDLQASDHAAYAWCPGRHPRTLL
jgi:hypothetical protein